MAAKYCFMNKERVCDLTCKAAFEVDDPVDNVDCYFIWFSYQFGEGLIDMRRMMEFSMGMPGMPGGPSPGGGPMGGFGGAAPGGSPPGGGPKDPKGFSNN
ncbi:MAG: hypothetical protein ACI841_004661 [Planctomycetota bacterium]|jgi:hypothetical protein